MALLLMLRLASGDVARLVDMLCSTMPASDRLGRPSDALSGRCSPRLWGEASCGHACMQVGMQTH